MSIRMYFDPHRLIASRKLSRVGGLTSLSGDSTPEYWSNTYLSGMQVRWDSASRGGPYLQLEGLLTGEFCPKILQRFSKQEYRYAIGHEFTTIYESWEGKSVDSEIKVWRFGSEEVTSATAHLSCSGTRIELRGWVSPLEEPGFCLDLYRCVRKGCWDTYGLSVLETALSK